MKVDEISTKKKKAEIPSGPNLFCSTPSGLSIVKAEVLRKMTSLNALLKVKVSEPVWIPDAEEKL